jgi:hypothetical protein
MKELLNEFKTITIAIAAIAISAIIGLTIYNVNDRILMSKNIDSAISKGVDPVAVRCAFVTQTDTICVAYAASGKK